MNFLLEVYMETLYCVGGLGNTSEILDFLQGKVIFCRAGNPTLTQSDRPTSTPSSTGTSFAACHAVLSTHPPTENGFVERALNWGYKAPSAMG